MTPCLCPFPRTVKERGFQPRGSVLLFSIARLGVPSVLTEPYPWTCWVQRALGCTCVSLCICIYLYLSPVYIQFLLGTKDSGAFMCQCISLGCLVPPPSPQPRRCLSSHLIGGRKSDLGLCCELLAELTLHLGVSAPETVPSQYSVWPHPP